MPIWRKNHEVARNIVHFIGMGVFAASMLAICGYLNHKPILYGWGAAGVMGFPTAVCMAAVGVALYLVSRGESSEDVG